MLSCTDARTCHGGQVDRLCSSLLCIQRFRLSPLTTLNQARVYNRCSELISALSPRLCPRCVTGDLSPWRRRHLQPSAHQPLTAPLAHFPPKSWLATRPINTHSTSQLFIILESLQFQLPSCHWSLLRRDCLCSSCWELLTTCLNFFGNLLRIIIFWNNFVCINPLTLTLSYSCVIFFNRGGGGGGFWTAISTFTSPPWNPTPQYLSDLERQRVANIKLKTLLE